jgi:hypothetical protein
MTEEKKKDEATEAPVPAEDKTEDPLSEDDLKAVESIKERLEFFFSNANIRQDLFLRKLLTSDEKAVPVEVMLRFNTIKKISEKPEVLLKAAKELTDLLVVDEKKSVIRRAIPFTIDMMKENLNLSLHVKNLPIKEEPGNGDDTNQVVKKYDVHVDEVRALFGKYGDLALVKLQYASDEGGKHRGDTPNKKRQKYPAGTALIEFRSEEDLKNAAEATLTMKDGEKLEPKEKVILPPSESRKEPIELDIMLFSEFLQSKRNNRRDNSKKNNKKRGRDEVDDDDDDAKESHPTPKYTVDWKPGCVIKLKGVPDGCDREAMLECLATGLETDMDGVKSRKIYVDFSRGQHDGAIRFPEPSDSIAELAKRLKEGELKINDTKVEEVYILEGDEETKYWEDFMAFKTRHMGQKHGHDKKKSKSHRRSH